MKLNEEYALPGVGDLVARKRGGEERATLDSAAGVAHEAVFRALLARLEEAARASALPEAPTAREALSDLLVRLRLAHAGEEGL